MRFTTIVIADLKTSEQCYDAIACIESDHNNFQGGLTRWLSGYTVYPLAGAQKKLDAIHRKNDKIWTAMTKVEYKIFSKKNPGISFEEYEEHYVC